MTDIIMYDDDCVTYRENIKGWVSNGDIFYGDKWDSEDMARYASCTHKVCDCGEIMEKYYIVCSKCREKNDIQRYKNRPYKEYNGEPLYSDYLDEYFIDVDTFNYHCYDNELDVNDMRIIICEYNYCTEIDPIDYYQVIMAEESEYLPVQIMEAFNELNRIISGCKEYISYSPGKYRTKV